MKVLLTIGILLPLAALAQALHDGPYLLYRQGDVLSLVVDNGQLKKDSFPYSERPGREIEVAIPGTAGQFFKLPLKAAFENEPSTFRAPEKMLVLSDIEGEFAAFRRLLEGGGVIGPQLQWTFGKGHLVLCGDLFDRGTDVTACLWLLYKLEDEARAAGGYVHLVLGNHEIMNLSEDTRYVHPKYQHVAHMAALPYTELYSVNAELGRWLRTKNIMEKIGDFLFLHAGASATLNASGMSIGRINRKARPLYDKDGIDEVLQKEGAEWLFSSRHSPFWYRGYFTAPLATMAQVDSTLQLFGVKHIVVGHTLVDEITALYEGKVIAIDVNHHKQAGEALFIEKGALYRLKADGTRTPLQ